MLYAVITLVREGIEKYQGPEVHCKYNSGYEAQERNSACDALQLGSLLRGASAIGIWPVPAPPYEGLSWESVEAKLRRMKVTPLCQSPFGRVSYVPEHSVMLPIVQQINLLREHMEGLPLDF